MLVPIIDSYNVHFYMFLAEVSTLTLISERYIFKLGSDRHNIRKICHAGVDINAGKDTS